MFVITKLAPTKSNRMAVFFNGHFDFSVDMETYALHHLTVGMDLSGEEYDALRGDTQYRQAKEKAFHLLSYKSYTKFMLEQRLQQDFEREVVEDVVQRLEELGLIDDSDYALRCAKDLFHLKKYGQCRVRQELRRRGIEPAVIEDTLAQLQEEDDPAQRIRQVLKKKYLRGLGEEKGRRRAVQGLMRLGYSYPEIQHEITFLLEDEEGGAWED